MRKRVLAGGPADRRTGGRADGRTGADGRTDRLSPWWERTRRRGRSAAWSAALRSQSRWPRWNI